MSIPLGAEAIFATIQDVGDEATSTIPTAANPTANVAAAPVNGTATTFMRSDAAPALADTTVAPGSYTHTSLTVDQQGRITAASSGTPASGVSTITFGTTGLTPASKTNGDVSVGGTLAVANGGTGATSLTDGGVILGSGAGAVTALAQATDGQLIIGSNGLDPVLANLGGTGSVSVSNSAGAIALDLADTAVAPGSYTHTSLTVNQKGQITGASSGTVGGVSTITFGSTGLTPGTKTDGDVSVAGTLVVGNGGTGATSLTDGGVILGSGAGAVTSLGQATNGQLIIGSSGGDPVLGTLEAAVGPGGPDIFTITPGAGTITIALDIKDQKTSGHAVYYDPTVGIGFNYKS